MELVKKLESMVAGWLKPLPHLPASVTKWISANIWWITLVGVILSVIGVFSLISALLVAAALVGGVTSIYGIEVVSSYHSFSLFGSLVPIIFLVATIVLTAMAVSPLKLNHKKGWDLLFLTLILQAVSVVVSAIAYLNVFSFVYSIIFGAISVAISAYFLYEIRSYFVGTGAKAKTETEKK